MRYWEDNDNFQNDLIVKKNATNFWHALFQTIPAALAGHSSAGERDNEEDLTRRARTCRKKCIRRVTARRLDTDAEDIYEVEYRKLRLERVILVGVRIEAPSLK